MERGAFPRGACARERTFLWMVHSLAGMTVGTDLLGVTNLVRGLGLFAGCLDRRLDRWHSPALTLETPTRRWGRVVCAPPPGLPVAATGRLTAGPERLRQRAEDDPAAQPLQVPEEGRARSGLPDRWDRVSPIAHPFVVCTLKTRRSPTVRHGRRRIFK